MATSSPFDFLPPFSIGEEVEVFGLQKSPHLNHRIGHVVGEVLDNGRCQVSLVGKGKVMETSKKAIKPENLKPFEGFRACCQHCMIVFNQKHLEVCSGCHSVSYCSQECQKDHWQKLHKNDCKLFQEGQKARHDETKLPADPLERYNVRCARALRWFQKGKYANAEKEFRTILQETSLESIGTYNVLVQTIIQQRPGQEKLKEAIELMQKAVTFSTRKPYEARALPHSYLLLGDLYFYYLKPNDRDKAEQAYNEVLKRASKDEPDIFDAQRSLGIIQWQRAGAAFAASRRR